MSTNDYQVGTLELFRGSIRGRIAVGRNPNGAILFASFDLREDACKPNLSCTKRTLDQIHSVG